MSNDRNTNEVLDPVIKPFADFWSSYCSQANDTTRELLAGMNGNADVKTWQRRWFDAVSKSMDAYMRSPMPSAGNETEFRCSDQSQASSRRPGDGNCS